MLPKMETAREKPSITSNEIKNLKKITHIYLHDKYLKKIPKLCQNTNLTVIYLHNNEIFEIEKLEGVFPNLSSLYLQYNFIQKMQNLNLSHLRRLYLGHNSITVVEGLENVGELQELHLEKQYLNLGACMCFDPRSIAKISEKLQILNISNNRIPSLLCLSPLRRLITLDASHNELDDLDEVCIVIGNWFHLRNLSLSGNPIMKNRIYKESIISNANCLEVFDRKDITATTRNFFKRLHREKVLQNLRKSRNIADQIDNLPKNYPISIEKSVSTSILKRTRGDLNDLAIFNEENAVFIPWRALPEPHPVTKVPIMLRNRKRVKDGKVKFAENKFANIKI